MKINYTLTGLKTMYEYVGVGDDDDDVQRYPYT